jgi:alanyl-tRNA synthetase
MDIREEFLRFFEQKRHKRVPSAPLVPEDATLLFNNAGMVPFKSIFTGEVPVPENPRAVSCQTCVRAGGKHNDLENVGYTARHHTFFEMLGNFSFGDYFKTEAIAYAWEFITEVLGFEKENLWVTVHESDTEAKELWQHHIAADRILALGDKDNFWQMGDTGPCGPSSEIFYDQGEADFNGPQDYLGGDGDRFLEIWNLVFMQYERNAKGELHPLPKPSIDTGMGLERVTAIKEGAKSNYDSSLFMPLIEKVAVMTAKPYMYAQGSSYRVIADHIRTVAFLLAQGVNFSNEGRGYVLRRILRRGVRHGYLLGLTEPFMYKLVDTLVELMGKEYGYLAEKADTLKEQIELEEARFFKTIEAGIALFDEELAKTKDIFSGATAFKLYDTYGFPLDLTQDMLRDKGIELDIATFDTLMDEQKARAKAAWKGSGDEIAQGDFKKLLEEFGENRFIGYTQMHSPAKITALLSEDFEVVDQLHARQHGWVFLDQTPFYAQGGGQVGDKGELEGVAFVTDTKKFYNLILSHVQTTQTIQVGQEVNAIVDTQRLEVQKHHSATHLLHAALCDVLGAHVSQAGSLVEADRLRFDFSHPKALSFDEIAQIEEQVNGAVFTALAGLTEEMAIEDAKKSGAKAQFGEKYGEKVRVVRFGGESVEFCGGTHVANTAEIGTFIIAKESGVSAGVRRIEAVCGRSAYNYLKSERHLCNVAKESVKNQDLLAGIERLKGQIATLKDELGEAQKAGKEQLSVQTIGNTAVVVDQIAAGDIKERIDELKNQNESLCAMLFQVKGDKVLIAAGVKSANAKAGEWIKAIAPILGGGGGGRPDFAQAGGKDVTKLDEAKTAAFEFIKKVLS